MKKLVLVVATLLGIVTSEAQPFQARSFMAGGIAAVVLTNTPFAFSGGGQFTNLASPMAYPVRTNVFGLAWSNASSQFVFVTNNTPQVFTNGVVTVTNDSTQLFIDVPLWSDRNGQIEALNIGSNPTSNISMSCSYFIGSAASGATFVFAGLPDGKDEVTGGDVMTWTWKLPASPASNGFGTTSTNFPIWQFSGCGKLRVRSALVTTTNAGTAGNNFTITEISLNGFVP